VTEQQAGGVASGADATDGPDGSQNAWDSALYDQSFSVITRLGSGVVDLLAAQPGERILDLGCGTGHLTAQIAHAGAETIGIDSAEPMIARAREAYPNLRFEVARGEDFSLDAPVDGVFSSAVLHWIPSQDAMLACVARALRPGGRFVAEMGGQGNVKTLLDALCQAVAEEGVSPEQVHIPWYFPSIPEYGARLERAGFEVTFMHLFDRPTPLDDCPDGAADWVRMFGDDFLGAVRQDRHEQVLARINELAAPALVHDGRWIADYRRLRFVAIKR
jgi:trans-aconitate methyltransferase